MRSTVDDEVLLARSERELRRDLWLSRLAGNIAGGALIFVAAMAWHTGDGRWFAGYLVGSVILAAIINELSRYTRERQHARDLDWARRLHTLATHDELTGLKNRRCFNDEFDRRLETASAARTPLVLAVIDMDGLKQINDSLGHASGDIALRMVAGAIEAASPPGSLVARVGGDEFSVLAEGIDGPVLKEAIEAAVAAAPFSAPGSGAIPLAVSVGFATGLPGSGPAALFRAADEALYLEKSRRNASRRAA